MSTAAADTSHAYRDVPAFHDFAVGAFDPACYAPLPAEWVVLVADIVGSTAAVERGRYVEVNYLGAACIVAVANAVPELSLPSSFGGDGATLAVPPGARRRAERALLAVRGWGERTFGLELRIGAVEVGELEARGATLSVGKLEFSPGNALAMFRGDGFDLADRLVKEGDGARSFRVGEGESVAEMPDLETLSCRWEPLESANGEMLCIIVGARAPTREAADEIYRGVVAAIHERVGLDDDASNPIKASKARFRLPSHGLLREVRSRAGAFLPNLLAVVALHAFIWTINRFDIRVGDFDPARYRRELAINADFRRVNGMLRLVLDCTPAQAAAIEAELERRRAEGSVVYGVHRASHALMTCVVPEASAGRHVHFVDGAEGGFWSAARQLKRQLEAT